MSRLTPSWVSKNKTLFLAGGAGVLIILGILFGTGALAPTLAPDSTNKDIPPVSTSTNETTVPLSEQLSKSRYLKAVYEIRRDEYDLYEAAAVYRNETLEETRAFFYTCCGLAREEDIFAQLPSVPEDFSDVAYGLAIGRLYQIAQLSENYYKQPEFYFHGDEIASVNRFFAFKGWSQPELNVWGDYAFGAYPSDQYDTISHSGRKTFSAVVFSFNGWNIQNYVGVNLVPDASSEKYFDLTISEDQTGKPYFLLGPTFSYFDKDWATKVFIEGEVKPDTPPGVYTIVLSPISPPKDLNEKWSSEYTGLYAPYGAIGPSGGYITLNITVSE